MTRRRRSTARRSRTTASRRTYRRRRSTATRSTVNLGSRPVLTLGMWLGLCAGAGFLGYAAWGTAVWSDETLAVIPTRMAVLLAFSFFVVAAGVFAGFQFGLFDGVTEPPARRSRRSRSYTYRRR